MIRHTIIIITTTTIIIIIITIIIIRSQFGFKDAMAHRQGPYTHGFDRTSRARAILQQHTHEELVEFSMQLIGLLYDVQENIRSYAAEPTLSVDDALLRILGQRLMAIKGKGKGSGKGMGLDTGGKGSGAGKNKGGTGTGKSKSWWHDEWPDGGSSSNEEEVEEET